jgi:hypothetical protein
MSIRTQEVTPQVREWQVRLSAARDRLEAAREEADAADEAFRQIVCDAFDAGLSVTPIQMAVGLTASRVYQIKRGRRT